MQFLGAIITLVCGFYILKNLFIILRDYVGDFVYSLNISRTESGNQVVAMIFTLVITLLSFFLILTFSYLIFRGLYLIPIIAISLYFKFGTDAGTYKG